MPSLTTPSKSDYLNVSAAVYTNASSSPPSAPPGFTLVASTSSTNSGMQAAAFKNTSTGQIIISYEGTNLHNCLSASSVDRAFCGAQLTTNKAIGTGQTNIPANTDALNFAQQVAQNNPGSQIFVTGHSLGGEEAQYVMARAADVSINISGGVAFGAPGVPGLTANSSSFGSNFTNYVDYGDAVGNFVPSNGSHIGSVVYVGDSTSSELNLSNHLLKKYASDMGVTLQNSANQSLNGSADISAFSNALNAAGYAPFGGVNSDSGSVGDVYVQNGSIAIGNNTVTLNADGVVTINVSSSSTNSNGTEIIQVLNSDGSSQNEQVITTSTNGSATDKVSGTGAVVNLSNAAVTLADGASATINGSQLQINVGISSQAAVNGQDLSIAGASGAMVTANSNMKLSYDAFGNPTVLLGGATAPTTTVSNGGVGFAENTVSGGTLSGQITQNGQVTAQKTDANGNSVTETGQAAAMPTAQQTAVNAGDANAVAAYLAESALDANQAAGGTGSISDAQLQRIETLTSDPGEVSQGDLFASIYEAASVQYTQRAVLSDQFVSKAAASLGISVQGAGALLANGATVIETLASIKDAAEHPTIRSVASATYQALQSGVTFSADFKVSLANALMGDPVGSTAAEIAASQATNLKQLDSLIGNLGTPLSVIAGIANPTPATVFAAGNAVASQLGAGLAFPTATAIASAIGFIQNPTPTNAANTALWTIAAFQPEFIPVAVAVTAVETVVNFVTGGKPIVLDMTGNGINLTSVNQSSAYFDLNGDGKREHYGWTGAGNAFLVYDSKGDNNINSASGLSFVGDSAGARTDLEGLIAFDTNHDGKFDKNDAAWKSFKVWQDSNGDGVSQVSELKTLDQVGIASLTLSSDGIRRNIAGNTVYGEGVFTRTDGTKGTFADVQLATDGQVAPTAPVTQTASKAGAFSYFAPLVLNLVGGAVSTTPLSSSSVTFDVQGSGSGVKTGWITPDEGFLVLDKNGNGKIDDGTEMIGSFADLAKFDTSGKGVIDASNSIYSQLKVWVDKSGDGVSKTTEIYSLAQLGIASINVNAATTDNYSNGNIVHAIGSFTFADGSKGQIADAWLAAGTASTGTVTTITSGAAIVHTASGQTVEFLNGASGQTVNAGLDGVDVVVGGNNKNTLTAGNAGSAVLIGGSAGDTLISGAGTATLISNGNGGVVTAGSGQATIQVNGNATSVTDILGSANVTVNGSGNSVTLGVAGDNVTLGGSGNTLITTGAAASATNLNVTGTAEIANLSSSQITLGNTASLNLTGSNNSITENGNATLTGTVSGGTLTANGLGNNAAISNAKVNVASGGGVNLSGNADTINLTGGGTVNVATTSTGDILNISGQSNAATISNTSINLAANASVALNGSNDKLSETGGDVVTGNVMNSQISVSGAGNSLYANQSAVTVADGAGLSFTGTGSSVSIGTNNNISVGGANNNVTARAESVSNTVANWATGWDYSSGYYSYIASYSTYTTDTTGQGDIVSISGTGETANLQRGTLNIAANSQVALTGSSETVNVGNNATLSAVGNNNAITIGSNDVLTTSGTGDALTVNGTGDTATLSSGRVTLANNAGLALTGASNSITGGSSDTLSVTGNSNSVSFSGTGDSLAINGTGETVGMSSGSLSMVNGSSANLTGSSDTVSLGANNSLTATGNSLNVTASGASDTVRITGNSATINAAGAGDAITVLGAGAIINAAGNNDTFNVSGGGATINAGGTGDILSLSGTANTVGLNSGSITLADGSSINLTGSSDSLNIGTNDTVNVVGNSDNVTARAESVSNTVANWATGWDYSSGYYSYIASYSTYTTDTTGQGDILKIYGTGDQVKGVSASQVSALTTAQANSLVSAMAGFAVPTAGAITVLASQQQSSTTLIAAAH